jgi:YHS domain-containing protein
MKNLLFLLFFISLYNLQAQVSHKPNVDKKGVAIDGYDPVTYFQNKATKGNPAIKSAESGATYFFENQANKDVFDKNPKAYLPQYGGWCAYAIGKTSQNVDINPKTFKIIDQKLYLFYNKLGTNTLKLWNEDEKELLTKANKNW